MYPCKISFVSKFLIALRFNILKPIPGAITKQNKKQQHLEHSQQVPGQWQASKVPPAAGNCNTVDK